MDGMLRDGAYEGERLDVIPHVPIGVSSLLDIGCGTGTLAAPLRRLRPDITRIVGVEANPTTAALARSALDEVRVGFFPDVSLHELFDCVAFVDVLEHMVDPWAALERARELLTPRGVVVASIPNMRYWPVLRDLVLRSRWDYVDQGVLDRTHLRWFTRATMQEFVESSGFDVVSVAPLARERPSSRKLRVLRMLRREWVDDVLTPQYVIVARSRTGS